MGTVEYLQESIQCFMRLDFPSAIAWSDTPYNYRAADEDRVTAQISIVEILR